MLLVQRPSSNATEGRKEGEGGQNGEKGTERLDIIEGDNLRRQMGKNGAWGEQMDSRKDGRRETRDTETLGGVRDLENGGVKKSDLGHYPCSISASLADVRLSAHYTS